MAAMETSPQFDEGYHGDTTSQPGSDAGTMTPDPHAELKVSILQLPAEARRQLVLELCQSLPNATRLALLDDIGAMVFHDPVPKLPNELMLQIFSHLSPKDLLTSSAVSRPWRDRTQDERLWRDCFAREGWVVDRQKMVDPEELAKKRGVKVAERIMRGKPKLMRNHSLKRQRSEAFSENESTLGQVGGPLRVESDSEGSIPESMEGPMEGVEPTDLTNIAAGSSGQVPKRSLGSLNNELGDLDSSVDMPDLQIQPSVFSTATEPKLSWSYLYKQRRRLESNWDNGKCRVFRLPQQEYEEKEGHTECVYTIQHHGNILLSGSRDKTIKIWDLNTCRLKGTLQGHEASVLCLQFDPRPGPNRDIIISGGSDSLIIVWKFSTGKVLHKFSAHTESVLNLRFDDRYLVTCSKDKTIKIWNRNAIHVDDPLVPARSVKMFVSDFGADHILQPYSNLDVLVGHQAAVNAVQINGNVIVSASGDRTIKSWDIHAGSHRKSYSGHSKGIACVQFDGRRVVSGSSDNSVRIFDYETAAEVACLDGHTSLVRTVQARFGDLDITTDEELLEQSREADKNFLRNLDRDGEPPRTSHRQHPRQRNAGSSRPEDMQSYGTKVPPGGGGSRWGRIVSGSYDESVIIWKRSKDGKWKPNQRLNQSAGQSVGRSPAPRANPQAAPLTVQQQQQLHAVQAQAVHQATNNFIQHNALPGQGNVGQNATALLAQLQGLQAVPPQVIPQPGPVAQPAPQAAAAQPAGAQPTAAPAANHAHHHHHHHHHNHAARTETNRVFKLQFDARRIVSCSQNKVVVGWDFANGDKDLEWIGDWSVETA